MGWFSDVLGSAGDLIGPVSNVAGALISSGAQSDAAGDIRDAAQRSAQISESARQAAQGQVRSGVDYQAGQVSAIGRAAVPGMLSPAQKISLDDTITAANRNLRAGGLAGSGRAQSAIVQDVIGKQRAGFATENQNKLDRVRETLGQIRAGEGRDLANIETGQAARAGDAVVSGARASAPYDVSGAVDLGQGIISTAKSVGSTLGGYLAEEEKRERNRAYGSTKV